jgi:hypothetical protein
MEKQEETFTISVEINQGLEPLTLTIVPDHPASLNSTQKPSFKVTRDNHTLALLRPDADHCWKLLEGDIKHEEVDAIGAAIDGHYSSEIM